MEAPIIRILGGPAIEAGPNLQQEPCSITGLSRLTNVANADLIALWLDDKITDLDESASLFDCQCNALSAVLRREVREYLQKICAQNPKKRANGLKTWRAPAKCSVPTPRIKLADNNSASAPRIKLADNNSAAPLSVRGWPLTEVPTGLKIPPDLLRKIIGELMAGVWTAVRRGGMAFVIIPAHAKTTQGFTITDIVRRLEIDRDYAAYIPVANADLSTAQEAARRMVGKLVDLIDDWPYRMGVRMSEKAPLEDQGDISCRFLCPAYGQKDLVHFLPATATLQGHDRSILMLHGDGAMFIIPPPRQLSEVVHAYLEIWQAVAPVLGQRKSPARGHALPPQPPQRGVPAKPKRRKAGRKPATKQQRAKDKRLYDCWQSAQKNAGSRLPVEEFAKEKNLDVRVVKRALDNHRKRAAALRAARQQRSCQSPP